MTQAVAQVRNVVARSGFANPLTLAVLVSSIDYLKVYADEELLQEGVDYSVTGIGASSGVEIEIIGAEDVGNYVGYVTFTALFDPDLDQPADLSAGGSFGQPYETAVDQQNRRLQALGDRVTRSLKMPVYVEGDIVLPPPTDGYVPSWDETTQEFIWVESPASSAASAAAAAASAATAAANAASAAAAAGDASAAQLAAEAAQLASEAAQLAAEAAAAAAANKLPLAGGTMTGPIVIDGISGVSWDARSITTGTLAAVDSSLVVLTPLANDTVTDITTTLGNIPLIVVRNASTTYSVTFTHNTAKLRLAGQVDHVLKPYESMVFTLVSGIIWQQLAHSTPAASVTFKNPTATTPVARALDTAIGEGRISVRDLLGDAATPSAAEWRAAFQAAHDDLKSTTGAVYFSEEVTFDTTPVLWDGYVSLIGTGYTVNHQYSEPEPHAGAIILGPSAGDLGTEDFGWGGGYSQPNGLINIKLDTAILSSGSRPRANIEFKNFGILGNGMTGGVGLRNVGTMYVNFRNLSMAFLPDHGIYNGSRGDVSPGSSNGCRMEDVLITSSGDSAALTTTGAVYWGVPDGHFSNIQLGGNLGYGMYLSGGQTTGDTLHIWNNGGDGLKVVGPNINLSNLLLYENGGSNLVFGSTAYNVRAHGQLIAPNRAANTASASSSNVYITSGADLITLDVTAEGDTYPTDVYADRTAWVTATAYTAGDYRVNANKLYKATTTGTSGATAPTHTTGSASDGTVTWEFQNGYGLYGLVVADADAVVNISPQSTFRNHRTLEMSGNDNPNIFGKYMKATKTPTSAAPVALFSATTEDAIWKVSCTRLSTNQDGVFATIIGGSTPVIHNKTQNGSTLDLDVNSGNIRITTTSGTAVTALCSYIRER